jgi:phage tail sheath protein FI
MPITPTYPGVYVQEISSGVRTITGVATSIAAFVGYTARGPDSVATRIFNFGDFERVFGGLAADSELSYAVQQFFANGGSEAYVVRVPKHGAAPAKIQLQDKVSAGKQSLTISAMSKGAWANNIIIDVDYGGIPESDKDAFNLTITDLDTGKTEAFTNVTVDKAKSNFVHAMVNDPDNGSKMVRVSVPSVDAGHQPVQTGTMGGNLIDAQTNKLTIFNSATASISDKEYSIKVSVTNNGSSGTPMLVPVIAQGEPLPGSVLGVCRLVESKVNLALQKDAALQKQLPGVTIRCVPSTIGASGQGIRVYASVPDAQITFAAGTTSETSVDADATLKLSTGTVNVSHYQLGKGRTALAQTAATPGADGTQLPSTEDLIAGINALEKVDLFNILCIPDATRAKPGDPSKTDDTGDGVQPNAVYSAALDYCKKRRAFLLIDAPPEIADVASATDWKSSGLTVHDPDGYGAAYFPRLKLGDPLNKFQLRTFAPCGVVAGVFARTDATRGVWKAPAGIDAVLNGVQGQVYKLTDAENGVLNQLGLNCFRVFPIYGPVAWGARTLAGADAQASEWKYVPVRRTALFIEESLFRGLKWVVFEPNDEPLWAQIRLNVGAFMHNLFRQGAFQGKTPREAYFVKCDKETTTQNDINLGIVNIVVGFAPLKPAEFVIITLQQMTGQIEV